MSIDSPGMRLPVAARPVSDFEDLRSLRAQASQDAPAALEAVAQQFEALFLNMMLDSMRAATITSDLSDSSEMDLYQQMFDRQVAAGFSSGGGLGLARMIVEQLSRTLPPQVGDNGEAAAAADVVAPAVVGVAAEEGAGGTLGAGSPAAFIRQVLPHARRAAAELGVHPMALVAQAALETGWGARLPRRADGESSFNLFGIKASEGWRGDRAVARTLEFEGGVAVRRSEQFRAYGGVEQAFSDYVRLIRENPRYAAARAAGADPLHYAEALQQAGYATDPAYAAKLRAILSSAPMTEAWPELDRGDLVSKT